MGGLRRPLAALQLMGLCAGLAAAQDGYHADILRQVCEAPGAKVYRWKDKDRCYGTVAGPGFQARLEVQVEKRSGVRDYTNHYNTLTIDFHSPEFIGLFAQDGPREKGYGSIIKGKEYLLSENAYHTNAFQDLYNQSIRRIHESRPQILAAGKARR